MSNDASSDSGAFDHAHHTAIQTMVSNNWLLLEDCSGFLQFVSMTKTSFEQRA
jgi:hypothetical protein